MKVRHFQVQSSGGANFGEVGAYSVRDALDKLAVEAGYRSHRELCLDAHSDPDSWTRNPAEFCRGGYDLLVTEVF